MEDSADENSVKKLGADSFRELNFILRVAFAVFNDF
jgi:hypothetical protein